MTVFVRHCAVCGGQFEAGAANARFCAGCYRDRRKERHRQEMQQRRANNREAARAYDREYRAKNKTKINKRQKERYAANSDLLRQRERARRAAKREHYRATARDYYARNKAKIREQARQWLADNPQYRERAAEKLREYYWANRDLYADKRRQKYIELAAARELLKEMGIIDHLSQRGVENETGKPA